MKAMEEHNSDLFWGATFVGVASFAAGAVGGLLIGRLSRGGGNRGPNGGSRGK